MFNKKAIAVLIIMICMTISVASACHCSTLRLMAMGDMQGIVEDDSDYQYDVTALPFNKQNNISLSVQSNHYVNSFDKDIFIILHPVDATEYDRRGLRELYTFSSTYKINRLLSLYIDYSNFNVNHELSYLYSSGVSAYDIDLTQKGFVENIAFGMTHKTLDWLILGGEFKQQYMHSAYYEDGYDIFFASPYSKTYYQTNISKKAVFSARLFNETSYISVNSAYKTDKTLDDFMPNQSDVISLGHKIYSGILTFRYSFAQDFGVLNGKTKATIGLQIKPNDDLLIGLGCSDDYVTSFHDYQFSSIKLGAEYKLNNSLSIRGGIISTGMAPFERTDLGNTSIPDGERFQDITAGIEYMLGEISIELSCIGYQDIPGMWNYWGIYPNLSEAPGASTYAPVPSKERNWVTMFGLNYKY